MTSTSTFASSASASASARLFCSSRKRKFLLALAVAAAASALIFGPTLMRQYRERKRREEEKRRIRLIFKKQAAHLGLRPLEEAVHILLLKAFDRFAADNDITYVLYGGTLIGAHRNGTVTPWDDDFDLLANNSHAADILQGFRHMDHFDAVRHSNYLLKVFSTTFALATFPKYGWSWPWLDVFLFDDAGDDIVSGNQNKSFRRPDFLPTRRIDFLGLRLPVPANATAVLDTSYREDVRRVCRPNTYDHRREEYLDEASNVAIDCRELKQDFNFPTI